MCRCPGCSSGAFASNGRSFSAQRAHDETCRTRLLWRLRRRTARNTPSAIFKERLGLGRADEWWVRDRFLPCAQAHYLILRGFDGRVDGCVRLLQSNRPTMLRDTFPVLLEGKTASKARPAPSPADSLNYQSPIWDRQPFNQLGRRSSRNRKMRFSITKRRYGGRCQKNDRKCQCDSNCAT
ncbi:acyl-homoserine-lactone synthase [Mesorhizobium sp. M7A.F.Ca.ET.027.02.1.1]|uniref:acyl-homoserine-lactone synthase n=1 Tax=unclassified Mesorhizobium TaxID=325217 RepID=UPI0032AEF269